MSHLIVLNVSNRSLEVWGNIQRSGRSPFFQKWTRAPKARTTYLSSEVSWTHSVSAAQCHQSRLWYLWTECRSTCYGGDRIQWEVLAIISSIAAAPLLLCVLKCQLRWLWHQVAVGASPGRHTQPVGHNGADQGPGGVIISLWWPGNALGCLG